MIASEKLYAILIHYEGCRLNSYQDSAGIYTIGFGNTFYEDGSKVKRGETITQNRAERLLMLIVKQFEIAVMELITFTLKDQCKYDALVDFAYNVGIWNLKQSTLLKKIKSNFNDPSIELEFLKWNKARNKHTGKMEVLAGLTARRESESCLYFYNEVKLF